MALTPESGIQTGADVAELAANIGNAIGYSLANAAELGVTVAIPPLFLITFPYEIFNIVQDLISIFGGLGRTVKTAGLIQVLGTDGSIYDAQIAAYLQQNYLNKGRVLSSAPEPGSWIGHFIAYLQALTGLQYPGTVQAGTIVRSIPVPGAQTPVHLGTFFVRSLDSLYPLKWSFLQGIFGVHYVIGPGYDVMTDDETDSIRTFAYQGRFNGPTLATWIQQGRPSQTFWNYPQYGNKPPLALNLRAQFRHNIERELRARIRAQGQGDGHGHPVPVPKPEPVPVPNGHPVPVPEPEPVPKPTPQQQCRELNISDVENLIRAERLGPAAAARLSAYAKWINDAARAYSLNPRLLLALANSEGGGKYQFRPGTLSSDTFNCGPDVNPAYKTNGRCHSVGIMQIDPRGYMGVLNGPGGDAALAKTLTGRDDLTNPELNIYLGAAILSAYLNQFSEMALPAITAYKHGPGNARKPRFYNGNDVRNVLRLANQLQGGPHVPRCTPSPLSDNAGVGASGPAQAQRVRIRVTKTPPPAAGGGGGAAALTAGEIVGLGAAAIVLLFLVI